MYRFINYNTITNYIPIIYKLSNLGHVLGVEYLVGIDPQVNGLAHYPVD